MVIATVVFPVFSEQFARRDYGHSIVLIKKSLVLCAVCYVAVAVMLVLFSRPLVSVVLQRGDFKANATVAVATVLSISAIGLVPSGLWDIMRAFFRAQNLHIYMLHVALIVLAGKVIFNFALYRYGVNGLAVSSAVTTWLGYAYLQYKLFGNLRMLRAAVTS
jgi:putative peptidoglycan lipid II flippase